MNCIIPNTHLNFLTSQLVNGFTPFSVHKKGYTMFGDGVALYFLRRLFW